MKPTTHSRTELYVHLVWSTKNRVDLLSTGVMRIIHETLAQTALKTDCEFIEWGGTADHLHTLVRIRPDMAVADIARQTKAALTFRTPADPRRGRSGDPVVYPQTAQILRGYQNSRAWNSRAGSARPGNGDAGRD
jgi:REP element-mobilizing transposase RayT